jgi:hypothetical protein
VPQDLGQVPLDAKLDFNVMSYNCLSQNCLRDNPYLYRSTAEEALDWNYRQQRLKTEILRLSADILCLQEVRPWAYGEGRPWTHHSIHCGQLPLKGWPPAGQAACNPGYPTSYASRFTTNTSAPFILLSSV